MEFQHYDLGQLNEGDLVEITLKDNAANVKLVDTPNFQYYKRGGRHKYYGGYITQSPFRISVPNSGRWHVVIDLGGYSGAIKSNVRVL